MYLLNEKVKHAVFGIGIVTKMDGIYIAIQFAEKSVEFIYPDAFKNFLKAENPAIQEAIMKNFRREPPLPLPTPPLPTPPPPPKPPTSPPPPKPPTPRPEGKRKTFFVFQGKTFFKEFRGKYLWAPISTKAGARPHHWTRLLDVHKGDIILHGVDGYVQAISVARATCYDCNRPVDLTVEKLWDIEGRKVDCDYTLISEPIKTSYFKDEIIRLRQDIYSPFNKDGKGNMGYLFEINRELMRVFLNASLKKNPYLASIDYIEELLKE